MDAFELRAAILSVRITLKLQRVKAHKRPRIISAAIPVSNLDGQPIPELERKVQKVVKSLERYTKRANRKFMALGSRGEFKARSKEWQSHLRWIRFHLAYFKPFRSIGSLIRTREWEDTDRLVAVAVRTIREKGFDVPDAKDLRHAIRLFMRYSRQGRLGRRNYLYVLQNSENRFARSSLFEFLEPRLKLKEAS